MFPLHPLSTKGFSLSLCNNLLVIKSLVMTSSHSAERSRAWQVISDVSQEVTTNLLSFWRISCRNEPPTDVSLTGCSYVVTGGNRGFGRGVVLELASRGARVFIGARDSGAAQGVIDESSRLHPLAPTPVYIPLDLTCFESIRSFCRQLRVELDGARLEGLVNNAALWMGTQSWKQVEGEREEMEPSWAVNVFGLALLTNLLLDDNLLLAPTGTIVNVSSLAHLSVPRVDTEDPMARNRPFDWIRNYAETKLALMFYTKQLAKQLKGRARVYAVDPGISQTDIGANFGPAAKFLMNLWIGRPITRAPIEGSRSILFPLLFSRQGKEYNVKRWYFW